MFTQNKNNLNLFHVYYINKNNFLKVSSEEITINQLFSNKTWDKKQFKQGIAICIISKEQKHKDHLKKKKAKTSSLFKT